MERLIMTNGMDPSQMTPAERIDELSTLLAMSMFRIWLKRRKERSNVRDNSLGNPADGWLPVTAGNHKETTE